MSIVINGFSRKIPLVDEKGCATQWMQIHGEQVRQLPNIIGDGDPEGVVSSQSGRLYFNSTGAPGNRLHFKALDEIGNDTTKGWVKP